MTAVSQSYPKYLGGLNEQPDELKKPGQLVEALNVIPDPVIGLTRRPGFELINTISNIDPGGTWFEVTRTNQINSDYIYFGCVNPNGRVIIFDQDGEEQVVKYLNNSIKPHKTYSYSGNTLKVLDDNGEEIGAPNGSPLVVNDTPLDYFKHTFDEPLQYCVSKDNIIFSNPTKIPSLADGAIPNDAAKTRYYSFINLKVVDTENYNYTFRRFYADNNIDTYTYIKNIEIESVDGLDDEWDTDLTLPLQQSSPFIFNLSGSGVTEQAIVRVNFVGQVVQLKSSDGDGYRNEARYTYTVGIIDPGKGYRKNQIYEETIGGINGLPDLKIRFKIVDVNTVTGTANQLIVPNVTNDMSADDILNSLSQEFQNAGIDKAVVVGNGLYLENSIEFSVDTTEIAVADCLNSQKMDGDVVPIVRVNTVAELPVECYAGFVVEVMNSFDDKNNYYLEFVSESQSIGDIDITKSDGYWEEIAKPYEKHNINTYSLPHMITMVEESDKTKFVFIVSRIDYEKRTAGTAKDNPSMFVDKTPITSLTYYKNRLFFLTKGGTIITSRAGEIDNLFLNTAINTSLIDPIDIIANSNQRVPIYASAVVNNGLVLFGESEQYSMTSNGDLFTTETANVTKIGNYTFDPVSDPVYLGTNIAFISGGMKRFYEMTNVYDRGPVDINERSQQVQQLFSNGAFDDLPTYGRGFNMPVSSREQSQIVIYKKYTDKGSPDMMIYRFRQESSQESSQTSWVRWKIGHDLPNDTQVCYVSLPKDNMFVVIKRAEQFFLYRMNSQSLNNVTGNLPTAPEFTDGWSENTLGNKFKTTITFPTIYPLGRESYDITSNVTIHRVKLSTAMIGTYDLTIDREGYDSYNLLVEQTPSDEYNADFPQLRGEHIETVPIYTRNKNLTLTMSTEYDAPLTLRSMTWEGDWNPPYYKRG